MRERKPPNPQPVKNIELLEVFYNTGQGHVRFKPTGEALIEELEDVFTPAEQLQLAVVLMQTALPLLAEAVPLDAAVLLPQVEQMTASAPEDGLAAAAELACAITAQLGAEVHFYNKLAEVEIVFSPEAVERLNGLDRKLLQEGVEEALRVLGPYQLRPDCRVFSGPEYCKVTLYEKERRIARVLETIAGGTVVALGDSAVDLGFLRLAPKHIDYRPFYLGNPQDIARCPGIRCAGVPMTAGGYQVLSAAAREVADHPGCLAAVIADIDNSIAPLERPIEVHMAALLQRLLAQKVRLYLITGGHIANRYFERVINPLRWQDGAGESAQ